MTANQFIQDYNRISEDPPQIIPKRELFALAYHYQKMPIKEVIKLLKEDDLEFRLGAVSILDWKARNKNTSLEEKHSVYAAYIDHHTYINDWGMVDRAAPYVVGGYLFDKDRKPLYDLAKSNNPMERRTAIVSTYFFIRQDDIEDTFKIAEILLHDTNIYVQKAVGSWVREASKRDKDKLISFLDKYASTMPRTILRSAIQKLDSKLKKHYLELK